MSRFPDLSCVLSNGIALSVKTEAEATEREREDKSEGAPDGPIQKESHRVSNVDKPDLGGWTGGSIWESGQVLAQLLSAEPERVRGKRVLELGTGCGLVGLVAGALGAREVVLTDQVLFMAAANLAANVSAMPEARLRFRLERLQWGDIAATVALKPPFEVLLGSDIMYHEEHHRALADTIAELSTIGTVVLWVTPDWCIEEPTELQTRLADYGFESREISGEPVVAEVLAQFQDEDKGRPAEPPWGRGPIRVVEMRRTSLPTARPRARM